MFELFEKLTDAVSKVPI